MSDMERISKRFQCAKMDVAGFVHGVLYGREEPAAEPLFFRCSGCGGYSTFRMVAPTLRGGPKDRNFECCSCRNRVSAEELHGFECLEAPEWETLQLVAEAARPHLDDAYNQGYICGWREGDCEEAAMEAAHGIMQALKGRLDD